MPHSSSAEISVDLTGIWEFIKNIGSQTPSKGAWLRDRQSGAGAGSLTDSTPRPLLLKSSAHKAHSPHLLSQAQPNCCFLQEVPINPSRLLDQRSCPAPPGPGASKRRGFRGNRLRKPRNQGPKRTRLGLVQLLYLLLARGWDQAAQDEWAKSRAPRSDWHGPW